MAARAAPVVERAAEVAEAVERSAAAARVCEREETGQACERAIEVRRGERRRFAVEEEVEGHLGALGERGGERGRGGEPLENKRSTASKSATAR